MASHYAAQLDAIAQSLAAIEARLGMTSAAVADHLTVVAANRAALASTASAVPSPEAPPAPNTLEGTQDATGAPGS